jgi:glycosyltransferase involved in cell wall biosynthesis
VNIARQMHELAERSDDAATRDAALRLEMYEKLREEPPADCPHPPESVLPVDPEFAALYADVACEGAVVAARSKVVVCGLARNIGHILPLTLQRIDRLGQSFGDWSLVVVENDSTDDTKEILREVADANPGRVVCDMRDLGRPYLRGFEPARVQAYAEYRNRYRELAREHYPDADYVIPIDLDAWGGWSDSGVLNGIGWLNRIERAACMASVSLFRDPRMRIGDHAVWAHYDQWAFRWQGWQNRLDEWFVFWRPPPGSHPLQVNSAFGGLAIYKAKPFWDHEYASDDGDIEHVGLHRRMIANGWGVFLNPAQRCVMMWMSDGGDHGNDQH